MSVAQPNKFDINKLTLRFSTGGSVGTEGHYLVVYDNKPLGHFYPDAVNEGDMSLFLEMFDKDRRHESNIHS